MPHVIFTRQADAGLRRCRRFLAEKSPMAADRASKEIAKGIQLLRTSPDIGRPVVGTNRRELLVPFGNSGYIALYRHDPLADVVYILAFRHQKELGYSPPSLHARRGAGAFD